MPDEDEVDALGGVWSAWPGAQETPDCDPDDDETEARGSGRGILGTGSAARVYRRSPPEDAAFGR